MSGWDLPGEGPIGFPVSGDTDSRVHLLHNWPRNRTFGEAQASPPLTYERGRVILPVVSGAHSPSLVERLNAPMANSRPQKGGSSRPGFRRSALRGGAGIPNHRYGYMRKQRKLIYPPQPWGSAPARRMACL